MALPEVGQTVYVDQPRQLGRGRARVLDMQDELLYLDRPVGESRHMEFAMQEGEQVRVSYVPAERVLYYFDAVVVGVQPLGILPSFQVRTPGKGQIIRVQRRSFVRVELPLSLIVTAIHRDGEELPLSEGTGYTIDLSGGGMSFILNQDIALTIGDIIIATLTLQDPGRKPVEVEMRAVIVRNSGPAQEKHVIHSARFTDIAPTVQQKLIQLVFRRQIEIRGKL